MHHHRIQIDLQIFPDRKALDSEDAHLLEAAGGAIGHAYAPYSNFRVGAALRLIDGSIVTGSNQENASFPAGICAERVALSTLSSVHPGKAVTALALTYINETGESVRPISPCGICRQSLVEYEQRFEQKIRLILGGSRGEIFILSKATDLLPFAFSNQELKSK
jgi:cytidine deaminase